MLGRHIAIWRFMAVFCAVLMICAMILDTLVYGVIRDAVRGYIFSFDRTVIEAVRIHTSDSLSRIMMIVTELGAMPFYVVFGGIITIICCFRRHILEGIMLVVCSGGSGLMTLVIKSIVMRIRPDMMPVIIETGYSFPSGHSVTAVCFYGYLAFLCYRYGRSMWIRRGGIVINAMMIVLIGISRIYLGVHYPTDVLGGYIGGIMWFGMSLLLIDYLEKRQIKKLP